MRVASASLVILPTLFAGIASYAQDLPTFDDSDFEILSVLSETSVLAKSDGRDFICRANDNSAAGYIEIYAWSCRPYVNSEETMFADKRLAEAKAAAQAAADAAAQAAAEAEAAAVAASASAQSAAANAAAEKQQEDLGTVADLNESEIIEILGTLARKENCTVAAGTATSAYRQLVIEVTESAGFDIAKMNRPQIDTIRSLMKEAIADLYRDGRVVYSEKGTKMTIKDCN